MFLSKKKMREKKVKQKTVYFRNSLPVVEAISRYFEFVKKGTQFLNLGIRNYSGPRLSGNRAVIPVLNVNDPVGFSACNYCVSGIDCSVVFYMPSQNISGISWPELSFQLKQFEMDVEHIVILYLEKCKTFLSVLYRYSRLKNLCNKFMVV
jgi:hypothetical protein